CDGLVLIGARVHRGYFLGAYRQINVPQENIPDGPVLRSVQGHRNRFSSGLNLSLERQLSEKQFAQLRLNLNYSPQSNQTLEMPNNARTMISQEGFGFSLDYRRAWKKGIFTVSAGIGAGGKWYIKPSLSFLARMDSAAAAEIIAEFPNNIQIDNFGPVIMQGGGIGPVRARVDYNIYLPFGVAIELTRRIQLELDARLSAGAQQIIGDGLYTRPIGGTFRFAYVFLL
ncbi:MAG: hypothetical protein AAFN10_28520, partial [Bacteroidota bacterium]